MILAIADLILEIVFFILEDAKNISEDAFSILEVAETISAIAGFSPDKAGMVLRVWSIRCRTDVNSFRRLLRVNYFETILQIAKSVYSGFTASVGGKSIPAATVAFVPCSMRMNEPVSRLVV